MGWFFQCFKFPMQTFLLLAYLRVYVANSSDTWGSEIGITSNAKPFFILKPWQRTYHGVNGGFTWLGLVMSVLCGLSYILLILGMNIVGLIAYYLYNQLTLHIENALNQLNSIQL